jgi:polyribonucleotide nucleotidyltransferase
MKEYQIEVAGRPLILETGRLAKQANGSVLVKYGETYVLVTACMSRSPREGIDFFPLLVDYEERLYSVGKIPGSFLKREGRPGEKAILAARLIDRPLRPLFPKEFRNDVQVVATVLSVDQDNPPEIAAMVGASAALTISDIPFGGPVGAVVIGMVDDKLIVNPTVAQQEQSKLHITVAGTKDAIMMVEAGAEEVSEETIVEALMLAHEEIKKLVALQEQMRAELGKAKIEVSKHDIDPDLLSEVRAFAYDRLVAGVQQGIKQERIEALEVLKDDARVHFAEKYGERMNEVMGAIDGLLREIVRGLILDKGLRADGRSLQEIRPITCDVGILPRAHGSGLFTRGQTQALSVVTLGAVGDVQVLDDLGIDESKRYMHHYNFPPYSVGETRPMRGPSRRDIGHGALGERALRPMIPPEEEFPYTIRVVSEVLESNGSSSQASICGSTLGLLDAGVPLKAPVAGIAMGLIKEGERLAILSDIQGLEDHLGDMDFKVAGTRNGITALQMDIKIDGVNRDILSRALEQAKRGRFFILDKMMEVINQPRPELSPYAPRIFTLTIGVDKIKDVIGPGGKVINKIISETGVKIDVEEDGRIFITSPDATNGEQARRMIENIVKEVAVGEVYLGRVVRIEKYGAFVELLPGKDGLVHISHLAEARVNQTEDIVSLNDRVLVKVIEIDQDGKVRLSRRQALQDDARKELPPEVLHGVTQNT